MSRAFTAAIARSTTSTFSCDIARPVSRGEGEGRESTPAGQQTAGWVGS
jgi:hypothetical protein